jgi:hypothetical protein
VDQLAQRIGGKVGSEQPGRRLRGRAAMGDLVEPRPARAAAIAEEIALGGVEEGDSRNPPVARGGAAAGDAEARVAERRAFLERAGGLAVDPILAALGDRGDALADQRPARRALDPEDHPVGPGLPLEFVDRHRLGGRGGAGGVAAAAEILDPRDEVADLRLAPLRGRAESPESGSDLAAQREIAGAEAGQGVDHVRRKVAAVAQQAARDRPEARQKLEPASESSRAPASRGAGHRRLVLGEEGERRRADSPAGERPGDLAPRLGRTCARFALSQASASPGSRWRFGPGRADRRAGATWRRARRAAPRSASAPSRSCRRNASGQPFVNGPRAGPANR